MIAPGTEAVRRGRPGRPHAAACLTLLCTAGAALASPPLTLVYETRVRVEVRLLLHDGSGAATEIEEVLTGVSGDRLALAEVIPQAAGPLAVGVLIEARPDEEAAHCDLMIESELRRHGAESVTTKRHAKVEAGRLLLTEIWGDASTGRRLVLAVVTTWEKVPTISALVPGAEPLDLLVEVFLGHGEAGELVERHQLGGLVGSPISYTFRQLPGASPVGARPDEEIGELRIEVLPHDIRGGKADLDIKIEHVGTSPYSKIASMNLSLRERLAPGFSVSMPLPLGVEGVPLVFRITPYF